MAGTRYIAKKVGDRYELQERSTSAAVASSGWAIGGGLLALFGISRRSIPGALMAVAGGAMAYRGVTGRNPLHSLWHLCSACDKSNPSETPSFQHDYRRRSGQIPQNEVEEASMESFPASDPPALTRSAESR